MGFLVLAPSSAFLPPLRGTSLQEGGKGGVNRRAPIGGKGDQLPCVVSGVSLPCTAYHEYASEILPMFSPIQVSR